MPCDEDNFNTCLDELLNSCSNEKEKNYINFIMTKKSYKKLLNAFFKECYGWPLKENTFDKLYKYMEEL